jgi:predicted RNase H-like HicB family nuclease
MSTVEYPHYSMVIEWDPRDEIFVVSVPELPGCITHGSTYEEAIAQGRDAIEGWVEIARQRDEQLPEPRTFRENRREVAA